jgi:hypothetical protein
MRGLASSGDHFVRILLGGLAAAVITGAFSTVTWAKGNGRNFCVSFTTAPGAEIVGTTFQVPPAGKCKIFQGYFVSGTSATNAPSVGMGCTSSNKSSVSLTINTSFPEEDGRTLTDSITLALPALTGTDIEDGVASGAAFGPNSWDVSGGSCRGVPVPNSAGAFRGSPVAGAPGSP